MLCTQLIPSASQLPGHPGARQGQPHLPDEGFAEAAPGEQTELDAKPPGYRS